MSKKFAPGMKVRFTAKFLRNTGSYTGSAGLDRWVVQPCDCSLCGTGDFVATDESSDYGGQRHINVDNLQAVR
jgi:hypothetical protein